MNIFKKKEEKTAKVGKLISVESYDPEERKVHTVLLAQTLAENDFTVEHIQLNPPLIEDGSLNPRAGALLFAVEHYKAATQINEAMEKNDVVILEGYTLANVGFCGAFFQERLERVEFLKWLDNITYAIFELPRPHLTIVLNPLNSDKENLLLQASFLDAAKLSPNAKAVDYDPKPLLSRQVHNKIWELVRRIVLKNNLSQK
jgi:hypothetical protein